MNYVFLPVKQVFSRLHMTDGLYIVQVSLKDSSFYQAEPSPECNIRPESSRVISKRFWKCSQMSFSPHITAPLLNLIIKKVLYGFIKVKILPLQTWMQVNPQGDPSPISGRVVFVMCKCEVKGHLLLAICPVFLDRKIPCNVTYSWKLNPLYTEVA